MSTSPSPTRRDTTLTVITAVIAVAATVFTAVAVTYIVVL